MSNNGKGNGGGDVTVGYRYFMGVQLGVCHGPVDSVRRIIVGEREAWSGSVAANATITINKPDLFGGDDREGGVAGNVDVLMGAADQARNTYLTTHQGVTCPAYRGILSLVFKSFMWSSGNPYFKAPWVEVTRILKGWHNDSPWNPDDAVINTLDMNPAHMIYQCLTDPNWGMGYNTSDVNSDNFAGCAAQLKSEGFGLSIEWTDEQTIEEFVGTTLNHINAALGINMETGKFELRLIRADYDLETLTELNESNVLALNSFQRATFGDGVNEVVVVYVDRDGNDKPVGVQNLAAVAAQGAVISTTKRYPGIREPDLAAKVAMRDLDTLTANLAQVTVTTNRIMWNKSVGDVVKFVWPSLGIDGVPFRITKISKGTLTSGAITVTMVEDIFGLPTSSYTTAPPTQWVDNVVPPIPADAGMAVEAPYWEVVKNVSLANQAQLQPDYGFGMFLASRGAVRTPFGFVLSASSDDVTFDDVAKGNFSPTGVLANTISATQTNIVLSAAYDLDNVVLSSDGGYAYIGDECVSVISCNPSTGDVSVGRGILDTVPISHNAGVRVFFKTPAAAYDNIERTAGETVYYRPRPQTGIGTLDIDDAETEVLVFNHRAIRPYPPGNIKIADTYRPVTIAGPTVTMTWAHRDRLAQTVDFVDHTEGNIGPEEGVTYRVRVYNGGTLMRIYDVAGDKTSWTYPTADSTADGNLGVLRLTLNSVRDGVESWQAFDHTFARSVVSGGATYENKPATPALTATPAAFAVALSWAFGDGRTNIYQTELWVSDTPDFEDGTTLQYLAYPDVDYTHELERVGPIQWYWARVQDNNGILSDWSAVVSARPLRVDPTQTLAEIEGSLNETHLVDALNTRINLIDTPTTGLVDRTAANTADILTSAAAIASNTAAINTEQSARIAGDNALSSSITTLTASVDSNAAAITSEATARANADSALSSSITALGVQTASDISAAVASEATARANADSALSSSITALTATVNGNTAAISSEATARANADSALSSSITALGVQTASDISAAVATEATARADADSALSSSITALTAQTASDISAAVASEATARANADSALSSSISTLSSQVNGDIAAIETTQTAQASTLTGLSAQFTVKTDLNGFVTGFGFASTDAVDDDPHSEFVILANSLQLVSPTGAGGVKTPFAVTEVETGVWKALLNADVLIGGNLSVANLSTGALPNDVLFSLGGGVVELDGAGEIRVFKDLTENADYVRLTSGEIRFLTYAGGAYQTYNYLKRLEVGAANNNTLVTIPGYWKAQPKVMVSPASLKLYDSAYSGQSQSINCAPGTVTETSPGSGVWQFTPTATLTLGGNTGSSAINNTSGSTSSNSWTSSTQTTPANCSQITPTVSLQSQRGNGSSQYYYRSVKWRIEYWDGAQWVAGSYRTVAMGAQFGAISDSVAFDFPSAGTWQWRIYSEAFDTNGTVFGSVSYEYSTATRTNAGSVSDTLSGYGTKNITLNLGAYSVPSGWSIYRVDWNYSVSWYLYASTGGTASVSAPNFSKSLFKDPGSTTTSGSQSVTYQNTSATSYNGDLTGTLYNYGGAFGGAQSDLTISNGTATIYIRRPAPNSTTAANVYTLVSYAYSLTSAQILATGSLNWVAIGE